MQELQLKQRTVHYLEQLNQGEVSEIYEALEPQLAGKLSFYQLSEMARQLNWLTGPLEGLQKEKVQRLSNEEIGVSLEAQYRQMVMKIQFVYNEQGRIKRFGLTPVSEKRPLYKPICTADYSEEPVQLGAEPQVDGLLTLPSKAEKPPVIILIQGSGQSDYNEAVGALPNRPFADLAHGLAKWGIATLRFHKRFYQYPPQNAEQAAQITVEQEILADARAALAWASRDERLNQQCILALGHSLGGYLMPRLAAEQTMLRGIIIMNGPWRPIAEIFAEQKRTLLANNAALNDLQKQAALLEIAEELAKLDNHKQQAAVFGQPKGYWYSLEQDHRQLLAQAQIAVLVLQGEYDFQVDGPAELAYWQEALAGRANSTCKLYPKLSHLMSPVADRSFDMALYDQPCPVSQAVIRDIALWVKALSTL